MPGISEPSDAAGRTVSAGTDRGWSHFPHDADIGISGCGPTVAIAFEQAARALTAVITEQVVQPRMAVEVRCAAPDPAFLLVEWLNALIYEMAARRMLFGDFTVSIDGDRLTGTARGEPVDIERHQPAVEVKAPPIPRSKSLSARTGCGERNA